ncbi:MAG: type I restriction-modification system subunit M [Hyphomicrobiales bacterium]|nr:type I restriction-modification system subunit M [Hyphomicrobiales bacterium]
MAIKKSQLYSSLWKSCDELRGGMDASQYKDYVLTLLFVKYVSDKRDTLIDVPAGGSFADMVRLKGDKEIGEKINKIIARLAEANDLRGVIDVADFNDSARLGDGQAMVDRLSKLIAIFEGIDLRANRVEGDDLLGDAYEYLMRHFATESGKSKGQFYTPAEVSRVMAKVIGVGPATRQDQTVYDPTAGSGSLLLKVADEAPRGLSIYGQELDVATWALARMNMFLHGYDTHEICRGNTLADPHWVNPDGSLKTFDFAVANPPFSQKNWTNGLDPAHDEFGRFELGIPPAKNGDYAFLLHILRSLKSTGKAAVILPHGVLFRGNAEAEIRRNLIRHGYIKGIIGLPPNLFYGTGIPACIIVLDKEQAQTRTGIFMLDASRGFIKDGNKNRLRDQDIHKIVDVFSRRQALPGYARMVSVREIEENDDNLNIPRYIDSSEPEDLHDLFAHLNGGIPERDVTALKRYWSVLPGLRDALFAPAEHTGYLHGRLPAAGVKAAILNHPDFAAYSARVEAIFAGWRAAHEATLRSLDSGSEPKRLIHELSEDLLDRFAQAELIDRYDVYQQLMDYWAEPMQDDVFMLVQDGWRQASRPRVIIEDKHNKSSETPDLVIDKHKYKTDLIPPALLIARYFAAEQAGIDALHAGKDSASQELEAFIEEQSGDDGLLEDARNDKGKLTKAGITARLREIKGEADSDDERAALLSCQRLLEAESAADSALKQAVRALDTQVLVKYGTLDEDEIKTLVVEDKWLAAIEADLRAELERVTQQLAGRVKDLEERYADPLPELEAEVDRLSERVEAHLRRMGLALGVGL